jgi:hypothetical protein
MADFCVEETTPLSDPGIPHDNRVGAGRRLPFREALWFWFKLGWISFGGTAAHIAIMHDDWSRRSGGSVMEGFFMR